MSALPLVAVNERGITGDGDDVNVYAAEDKVRAGLLENVAVRALYPDGSIRTGNLIRVTPRGMTRLRLEMLSAKGHA